MLCGVAGWGVPGCSVAECGMLCGVACCDVWYGMAQCKCSGVVSYMVWLGVVCDIV